MEKISLTSLMLLLCFANASAQSRWFRPDELYSYTAAALSLDKAGEPWAIITGTIHGNSEYVVQHFDGQSWTTASDSAHGFPLKKTVQLWDLATSSTDDSVIVTADNDVLIFNRRLQQWSHVSYTDTLTERSYQHVRVDSKGRIWVSGEGRMVTKRDTVNGVPIAFVRAYNEVFQLRSGKLDRLYQRASPGFWLTNPAEDSKGNIWFAYRTSDPSAGLLKYDGSAFVPLAVPDGCPATKGPIASCLHIDAHDNFVVGSHAYVDASNVRHSSSVTRITPDLKSFSEVTFPFEISHIPTVTTWRDHLYAGAESSTDSGGLYQIADSANRIAFEAAIPGYSALGYLQTVFDLKAAGNLLYCATGWGIVVIDQSQSGVPAAQVIPPFDGVFPNPAHRSADAVLDMELAEGETVAGAVVFDGIGRRASADVVVDGGPDQPLRIATHDLVPGRYFVHVRTSRGRTRTVGFVVDH